MAVAVCCPRGGSILVCLGSSRFFGCPAKLFDRAETNAIGFSKCSVNGAGFGYPQLGTANNGRDIGGIGITEADEAFRTAGLEHRSFKNPTIAGWVAEGREQLCPNALTAASLCDAQQASIRDVPATIDKTDIPSLSTDRKCCGKLAKLQ